MVGSAIYDAAPAGAAPALFVSLGAERVDARSSTCCAGALHRFTVSIIAQDQGGFVRAKEAAAAVCDALDGSTPSLERGRVVYMTFERADARRATGARRRIDLRFVARVEDN